MSETVIRVENLGKKYIIGHQRQERYTVLRDVISNGMRSLSDRLRYPSKPHVDPTHEEFWALKDISFEVKRGDRVGIIGRNGAGKSTLLKILSRITEPTRGRISIKGRVASLLEVGTGFHPELTGRENIFLNGAILGMSRVEISRAFDEIVAFAETEKFLDAPVKRYSSGMYVRLAFAVAAHMKPEILVVDEVLAVGDAQFQKKCLGKLEDVGEKEGRTVLFVSHNMESIQKLCSIGVHMQAGKLRNIGSIDNVVSQYLREFHPKQQALTESHILHFKDDQKADYQIARIEILTIDGTPKERVYTWDPVRFRIFYYSRNQLNAGSVVLQISTMSGFVITLCSTQPDSAVEVSFKAGVNYIDCIFPKLTLSAGRYLIGAGLAIPNAEWLCREFEGILDVLPWDVFNSGLAPDSARYVIPQNHRWEIGS